ACKIGRASRPMFFLSTLSQQAGEARFEHATSIHQLYQRKLARRLADGGDRNYGEELPAAVVHADAPALAGQVRHLLEHLARDVVPEAHRFVLGLPRDRDEI